MSTNDFTPLVPPQPSQVSINPVAKECPSDGFNYPIFRLLNKYERVALSPKGYGHQPNTLYLLFAVANSKGWFVAVTSQEDGTHCLVFSPLADLRTAFNSAKDPFAPQRTVSVNTQKPSIVAFASNETRLLVAFEGGEILVYDTATLFSPGTDPVTPIHALPSSTGPIRLLVPNPGTEPNSVDIFAAVHANKTVVLYNTKLEVQGGWISTHHEPDYTPVAVAWSPKGKHLAIGLQSGDILTYPLTNKNSIHKHVPPTNRSPLASLDWLTPGHTFRTTYGGLGTDPVQHIVCVDSKTPTATYYAPNFPFPLSDRSTQSYILTLPKWDEDAGSTQSKSLTVVADKASTDIEILGSTGTQWYQQSQESQLSLPLNDSQEDTLLLGLAVDLTDVQTRGPVIYAYLDDGTVQAWCLEHSKPYLGVSSQGAAAPTPSAFGQPASSAPVITAPSQALSAVGQPSAFGQTSTPTSAFGKPSAFGAQPAFGSTGFGTSTFGQTTPVATSAFGQTTPATTAFGQTAPSTTSAFGQSTPAITSAFGQTSMPGATAFGQTTPATSAFGQTTPTTTSAFGQTSTPTTSAFGGPSTFGQTSQSTSAFSNPQTQPSPFGQPANSSAFGAGSGAFGSGAFGGGVSSGAFGGGASSGAFGGGSGAFGGGGSSGAFGSSASPSAFGGSSSGAFGGGSSGAFGGGGANAPSSAFGGSSFGGNSTNNVFGGPSFGAAAPTSAFGGGGAFSSLASNTAHNAFGQGSFGAPSTTSGPAAAQGMSREASMSDSTPSLGGMGLGAPNDPSQPVKSGGIFGSFATSTTTTSSTSSPSAFGVIRPSSGAFSNLSAGTEQTPANVSAATSTSIIEPASGFGQPSFGASAFGQPSAFGQSSFGKPASPQPASVVSGGFGAFASSAPTSLAAAAKQTTAPASGGFGSFASASPSAFGSTTLTSPSPFGSTASTTASSGGFGALTSPPAAPTQPASLSPFAASSPKPSSPFASSGNDSSTPASGSAFGASASAFGASPFGPQPGVRLKSPSEKDDKSLTSTPAKSPILAGSPPLSPEAMPRLAKASIVSDNDSPSPPSAAKATTTPVTSPFGKISGPTSGAFGNLVSTPSVFKPATGFGAFGSDTTPASSPFFNSNAQPKTPAVSAFASALASPSSGAPSTSSSPVFGSPSALGALRSAFPVIAAGSPTPAKVPATAPFASSGNDSSTPASGSAFGASASAFGASPFGPQPGARLKSPSEKDDKSLTSTPAKSPILAGSPPLSPEATPRLAKASIVSDNDSPSPPSAAKATTTPVTSPFGKISGPTSGAFGNLVSTPSVFKPATGFGAFGSDTTPASSPFFNSNAQPKTPAVSAFASSLASPSSGAPSTSSSPAFGSPSALGALRSAFPVIAAGSPTPAKVPATGGFGAFSGTSTGFAAFAGPKKSFNELLKVGDNDATDPVKPSTASILAFPLIDKNTTVSVSTPPPKGAAAGKSERSSRDSKGKGTEKGGLSDEPSFSNLSSLSDTSSFTEINNEDSDEHGVHSGSDDGEGEEDEDSFLSDDLEIEEGEDEDDDRSISSEESSRLSDVPEEDEEEEEEEEAEATADPTAVPLPASRSPSATPQPEVPTLKITPSPPPESSLETVREESTTPPGTPVYTPAAPPARSAPASAPLTSPSTPFGLGLGRPSTRPTRSSPLANSAVSLTDDDEAPPSPMKPPVSPQPRTAVLPIKDDSDDSQASSKPLRPKTPPLLSAFGSLKPDVVPATPSTLATPSTTAVSPATTTPATPAPMFSVFGKRKPPTPETTSESEKSLSVPPVTEAPASPSPFGGFGGSSVKPVASAALPQGLGVAPPSTSTSIFGATPATTDLNLKGKLPETPAAPLSPLSQVPNLAPAPNPPSSLFGHSFTLPTVSEKGKAAPPPLFPGISATGSQPFAGPPIIFAGTAAPAVATTPAPRNMSGFSLGKGPAAAVGTTSLSAPSAPSSFISLAAPATPAKPLTNIPTEAGMQRECLLIYNAVSEDLTALGMAADSRTKVLANWSATGNIARTRADLLTGTRTWSPASSAQLGKVLVQFEKDLDELRDVRGTQRTQLREIQSNVLKARTRKEEIGRFNRAKNDKEFAKMLRARSLGPEHLETQAQLRRAIRNIRDRVQTLEDHLKGSKKKLTQVRTGRPSIRPPSLDSINRTYRNIDIALNQQTAQIALLKKRFAKLRSNSAQQSIAGTTSPPPGRERDPRLPSPRTNHRASNVTPDVAATTAAALNAERAAHRLKRALLQTRSAPMLNVTAATAPAPPLSFNTPQKEATPAWAPPERRGATSGKKHGVIPLVRKTGGSPGSHGPVYSGSGSASAPSFNWGPLPTFEYEKKGESFSMVETIKLTPTKK